jgi:hypothetical protein
VSHPIFPFAVAYCAVWLSLSIAWNARIVPDAVAIICRFLFVIPDWAFFAPSPLISDYRISIRQVSQSPGLLHVTPIELEAPSRWCVFFNPAKRPRKFLDDLLGLLFHHLRTARTADYREIHVSLPYLLLLNFARNQITSRGVTSITIIVEESRIVSGEKLTHTLFESVAHRI